MSYPTSQELLSALTDLVAKSANYGETADGFVHAYIVPTGPIHRAIAVLGSQGIHARPGFDPRGTAAAASITLRSEVMSYGNKSFDDMAAEVRQVNVEHGWRKEDKTFGDYIALLHSEASEALEAYRDYRLADATQPPACGSIDCDDYGDPSFGEGTCPASHATMPKPEGVGSEFADVFIRLLDMCDVYGIDLEFEYRRKLEYNRTRPYQHGGRTLNDAQSRPRRSPVSRETSALGSPPSAPFIFVVPPSYTVPEKRGTPMTEEWHKEVDRLNGLEEKSCEDICQTQCQGLCGAEEEEKK